MTDETELDSFFLACAAEDLGTEALEREGRARAVPHEALAPLVVVGLDAHRRLDVEAVARGGERASLLRLESSFGVVRTRGIALGDDGERATAKGHPRASFERAAFRLVVAAVVGGTVVDEAVLAKPTKAAITDTLDDTVEQGLGRWCEGVEADLAGVVRCEDAVGDDRVEMKVQVEVAAEPLRVVGRGVLAARDIGGPALL